MCHINFLSLEDNVGLVYQYHRQVVTKLRSCYNKCIKLFLGYHRRYSLTQVFLETGLPTFDTTMHNSACVFARSLQNCANGLGVKVLCDNYCSTDFGSSCTVQL